jgi:clan AA aspartic protease
MGVMNGYVTDHHALLGITFRTLAQTDIEIEYVIDTGFTGYLTMPLSAIQSLGLTFLRRMPANLADDSTIFVEVYLATILWAGEEKEVEVLATGRRPLVGTMLLDGYEMTVQFADQGLVTVDPL